MISVQHSERTISGEAAGGLSAVTKGAGPLAQSMGEHDDDRQRRQLAMARQAAALQQGLLNELHGMDEIEREKMLVEARDAHLSFLKQVRSCPSARNGSITYRVLILTHRDFLPFTSFGRPSRREPGLMGL